MLIDMDTVIVTRHAALLELIREKGWAPADAQVIEHVTDKSQIEGKHVIGILPLNLAVHCAAVTEIPMRLPPELRGKELDLATTRQLAGEPVSYKVTLYSTASR